MDKNETGYMGFNFDLKNPLEKRIYEDLCKKNRVERCVKMTTLFTNHYYDSGKIKDVETKEYINKLLSIIADLSKGISIGVDNNDKPSKESSFVCDKKINKEDVDIGFLDTKKVEKPNSEELLKNIFNSSFVEN